MSTSQAEASSSPGTSVIAAKPRSSGRPDFKQNANDLVFLIAKDDSKFTVHKAFACFYSPVLKAAFESEFVEGQTQTYVLSEYDADAVQLLVSWIYSQDGLPFQIQSSDDVELQRSFNREAIYTLTKVWVLAGYLCVPQLQNYIIRKLKELCDEFRFVPNSGLTYVYENTAVDSPLRKWYLHHCIREMKPEWYAKTPSNFPKAMLLEAVAELAKTRSGVPSGDDISADEVPVPPRT